MIMLNKVLIMLNNVISGRRIYLYEVSNLITKDVDYFDLRGNKLSGVDKFTVNGLEVKPLYKGGELSRIQEAVISLYDDDLENDVIAKEILANY